MTAAAGGTRLSERKGDIFTLVQHLDPGLNFGGARRVLRGFAGIAPAFPEALRARRTRGIGHSRSVERWERRRRLSRGSPVWRYLAGQRALPERILVAADAADAVREGPHGSAWFAHRDGAGRVTGIEMRGPAWRSFSAGGGKTLFRLPGGPGPLPRVAVCEAAIDALSLAAIERCAATRSMPRPPAAWVRRPSPRCSSFCCDLSTDQAGLLIAATDADTAGRRYAARLADLAAETGVRFDAILPPDGLNDWNDALRAMAPVP